jgi:hypothetical protein
MSLKKGKSRLYSKTQEGPHQKEKYEKRVQIKKIEESISNTVRCFVTFLADLYFVGKSLTVKKCVDLKNIIVLNHCFFLFFVWYSAFIMQSLTVPD